MSVATIEAFGEVIRAICRVCEDDYLRFWSFIRFVSVHHSDILEAQLQSEVEAECDAVLARAQPPPVTVEAPFSFEKWLQELLRKGSKEEEKQDAGPDGSA